MRAMDKLKVIETDTYITLENTHVLSTEEMLELVNFEISEQLLNPHDNITILVHSKFPEQVEKILRQRGFYLHDETLFVHKDLQQEELIGDSNLTFSSLHHVSTDIFKEAWGEVMSGSLNAPSTLHMNEQMMAVKKELGEAYKQSCLIASENGNTIGVVMPHIEPGTTNEGRLFYFGLVPSERGKGKSRKLHQSALSMLQRDFKARYYIGSTSVHNKPMVNTFVSNGCEITESYKVYKHIRGH